ncbi:MAG TPA: POTRA domain-containing protein [Vulgatibacter sp.]|nr:POTRA domain-containing protein [Vulgatibacter sp.]
MRRALVLALAACGLALPPSRAPAEVPSGPVVAEVEIRAPGLTDPEDYEPLVAISTGDPLSRRALRRTLQRLYETGRFANVTAFTSGLPSGAIRLVLVLEPRRPITAVHLVSEARVDGDQLRRASGLARGMEVSEDRIEAAATGVREALARAGYQDARVRIRTEPVSAGLEVHIDVSEGLPTRLKAFDLKGDPGDRELWMSAITLAAGDVLDRRRVEAELEALRARYRSAGHWRARVGQPRIVPVAPGLAQVEVDVDAGPRMSLRIRGNHAFDDARLRSFLAYAGEEHLDALMIAELASRIERRYRRVGYYDVRVQATERTSRDGREAEVVFHVAEGAPLLVRRVSFRGNYAIQNDEMQEMLAEILASSAESRSLLEKLEQGELDRALGTTARGGGSLLDPYLVYDDELYAQVVEELTARYRDLGFLDARIEAPRVEIDEVRRLAEVEIEIREGRRTRIRAVEYPGASALDPAALLSPSNPVAPGRPLSERQVEERRLELRSLYGRHGYLYATVRAEVVRPPEDPTRARVLFHVTEGPQVRVGRILVQGNNRTRRVVFDETLGLKEGSVLGSAELAASQQELMRLGLFRTAVVRPLDPEVVEPVKDLVVEVHERPSRTLEVGGGISIADGPRAFSEFVQRNILGRNLQASVRGRVNYQVFRDEVLEMPVEQGLERFVDLGFTYPRLYGLPIELGASLDLIHERDIRPAYRVTRYAALTGLDWPMTRRVTARVAYELESNWIERAPEIDDVYASLSRADLQRLRFPNGNTLLGSARPALLLNFQDDPVNPHAGVFAKVEADFARNLGGDTSVDFAKVWGTLTGYVPLGERTTLVLSASGGRVFPLREDSVTIAPKRFYLGGAATIRGFAEDDVVPEDLRDALRREIADCEALIFHVGCSRSAQFLQQGRAVPSTGGELFLLGRAELRYPIAGNLMGGVFLDAGNLWADPSNFDPASLRLRSAAGTGLRYGTPVGPVALDVGFNLEPDEVLREAPFALHFSIGLF